MLCWIPLVSLKDFAQLIKMAEKDLIPITVETAKEMGRKGGKARTPAKQRKKSEKCYKINLKKWNIN